MACSKVYKLIAGRCRVYLTLSSLCYCLDFVGHVVYLLQNEPPCLFTGDHIFIGGTGKWQLKGLD